MAPPRKSRSVNKRFLASSEVSPEKDGVNSIKNKLRKKKLTDKLGSEWSKEELEQFYQAYRKYDKDWKKVAAVVRNRSIEMVEALYNMNRAYLSLPEGTASVVGLIAMMTDHYNVLAGSDSGRESNDSPGSRKPLKRKIEKVQLSVSKDSVQSQSIASGDGCLSLLKKRRFDVSTMSGPSMKRKSIATQRPPREKTDPYFSKQKKDERFERVVLRKMATHKVLELDWFMDKGFEFPRLLVTQNLERFCTLTGNVYPRAVYEFYANLIKRNDEWVTNVNGRVITLNLSVLESVGNLQNNGLSYEDILDPDWSSFNALTTYENCLRQGKCYDGRTMKTGLITVNDRLLHYVLVYLIAPRLSNRAQMIDEDLRYIHAIKNGILVNWADVILNIMIRRFRDPSGVLPYPALVSRLIEHAEVEVEDEVKLSVRDGADKIGQAVLNKMKISRRGAEWAWDDDEVDAMAEDENPQITMDELLIRMQNCMDTSTGLIRDDIRRLSERIGQRFDQLELRVGNLETFASNPSRILPPDP